MTMRSSILVPLTDLNEVVGLVGVYMAAAAREWTPDEVVLLETVAAQLSATIQSTRMLAQTMARAEREALVNRIAKSQMDSSNPEDVQEIAVRLLGDYLAVDRCYFDTYDFPRDILAKGVDWHRDDLPSISGYYSVEEHKPVVDQLFKSGTAAITDVAIQLPPEAARTLQMLAHKAVLAAPVFRKNELVAALYAAMSDSQRVWTQAEIELVEQIAQLTGTAMEAVRVNMREHTIAERLQEALQPTIPDLAHGLRMSCFYRPALEEAEVGGDFADCFPTIDGCVIIVVGDLSGKGLDAAAQVATVRNMLRFAVYKERTIALAVNELNRVIAENRLVQGFATLFVGCYDSTKNELRYVNCGQEPGLVWKSKTDEVVYLDATGPIMGAFKNSTYDEITLPFFPGDQIAIFTDGLTEAGPSRRSMLGVEGVAAIYQNVLQTTSAPNDVVTKLVDRIIAASNNIIRDDICLLVGQVVTE
jgi:serine phosphatase RsbU (regulator of sigma subunit)